uniref:Uncharacterized protein n=1 Tax=Siphoviridae sp. ctJj91 TaxID=2827838 RepID=A0A8S5SY07_9CAUD|nr:MAG TPA: hypothetical protein [Siphoviridae sp. ctJj91]
MHLCGRFSPHLVVLWYSSYLEITNQCFVKKKRR